MGRGRPGGNPEFGKKYKFDYGNEEKRSVVLSMRITESFFEKIKKVGGDTFRDFCIEAIAEKVEKLEHDLK